MYLSLLGNLSLWSVIPNASSLGKSGRVESGRCFARTSLYKYVSLLSSLYIFIVADNPELFARCNEFVKNIRRDAMEGFCLPAGWELKLLSTGGSRQFDTNAIIQRYDMSIARTVLADFIFLGSNSVGSYALSSDKTALFAMAIGTYLDIISEVFNRQAIPRLIELNSKNFSGISDYPKLNHSDIETQNLQELGTYLKELVSLGLITPDSELENYLRDQASLPARLED